MAWSALRRGLRLIHLWVGLILCIPLVLIGISGSALLLQRGVLDATGPTASSGASQSIERMVEAARAAVPAGFNATFVDLPRVAGQVATVQFETPRRPIRRIDVAIDPVSLKVAEASDYVRRGPVKTVLVNIHEFLMLPAHIGFQVVGWMGVAMTFMGLSGLVLWWPRGGAWRQAFLLRRGARGLRLHLDLHHVVGIWGLAVLLALSVSGVYLIFPRTTTDIIQTVLPGEADDVPIGEQRRSGALSPDQAVAYAAEIVPGTRVVGLQLTGANGAPYVVQLERFGWELNSPPVMITLDPKTSEIVYIDDPHAHAPAERAVNLLHALHFATSLGPVWSVLVFLGGLMPLPMAVTGVAIWWKRRRRAMPTAATQSASAEA